MTLTRLHLTQFRSWSRLELDADDRPVAIHGPNGAGKTNILEAISMLAPGRGLRAALPGDQARKGPDVGWQIRATIDEYQVLTRALPGQPREVLVDDKPSPQIAFPMMPMPPRPGIRKSMYLDPVSRATSSATRIGSTRPAAACSAWLASNRALRASGWVSS